MHSVAQRRDRRSAFRPAVEGLEDRNLLSAGSLDPTFGNGGEVTFNWRPEVSGFITTVLSQTDGKLIVAGQSTLPAFPGVTTSPVIGRLNPDGSFDTSFGSNGEVFYDDWNGGPQNIALTKDGEIVVETLVQLPDKTIGYYVGRLNPDGTPDLSFAGTGSEEIRVGRQPYSYIWKVAVQSDGKIVLVGSGSGTSGFLAARLNIDGSRDETFGKNGEVYVSFASLGGSLVYAETVEIQSDGKLILAGETTGTIPDCLYLIPPPPGSCYEMSGGPPGEIRPTMGVVARLNADGSLDPTFGQGGELILSSFGTVTSVAERTDGDIVLGGASGLDTPQGVVALLNADGSYDTTFGTGGLVLNPNSGWVYQVMVRTDGSIVALEDTYLTVRGSDFSKSVVILRANGSPDLAFGTNSQVLGSSFPEPFHPFYDNSALLTLQPDGKIVIGSDYYFLDPSDPSMWLMGPIARLTATPVGPPLPPKPPEDCTHPVTIIVTIGYDPKPSCPPILPPLLPYGLNDVILPADSTGNGTNGQSTLVVPVVTGSIPLSSTTQPVLPPVEAASDALVIVPVAKSLAPSANSSSPVAGQFPITTQVPTQIVIPGGATVPLANGFYCSAGIDRLYRPDFGGITLTPEGGGMGGDSRDDATPPSLTPVALPNNDLLTNGVDFLHEFQSVEVRSPVEVKPQSCFSLAVERCFEASPIVAEVGSLSGTADSTDSSPPPALALLLLGWGSGFQREREKVTVTSRRRGNPIG